MSVTFESLLAGTARLLSWFHFAVVGFSLLMAHLAGVFSPPPEDMTPPVPAQATAASAPDTSPTVEALP